MQIYDCRPAPEARQALEEYTRRVQPDGLPIGSGIFRFSVGGEEGECVRRSDYFVLIVEGEAIAHTNGEEPVRLRAGQAVSWRKGEYYALEIPAGPCEYLTVEGDRFDRSDLVRALSRG